MKIVIDRVTKRFGTTVALDGISLEIASGELFFLLGSSGCGKTTLLRALAGFNAPDAGRVLFDDRDVTAVPAHRRNTAMVFQGYALWPHLTVARNVAFGLEMRHVAPAEREARVRAALERVRIAALAERKPHELSGGQQQRVALARTLVVEPACLLLDEPLANLDAKLRLDMREEIRRICKEAGLTAVYVTHDQKEALSMADRLAVMDKGVMCQVGPPREVYTRPLNAFVAGFIGEANFIAGRLRSRNGTAGEVDTAAGLLHSEALPAGVAPGQDVTVCVRPEQFRIVPQTDAAPGPNAIRAVVTHSTYLGEMAQYQFRTDGGTELKAVDLNPRQTLADGTAATLTAGPADVVVLPDRSVPGAA